MKILIVDDDLNNQILLTFILKPYGECIVAKDGREAVALFNKHLTKGDPFDLIFLDIMMPQMNGQEALREIRWLEKEANRAYRGAEYHPVIIMQTALGEPRDMEEAFFEGKCNGYITKPFTHNDVLEKLRRYHLID